MAQVPVYQQTQTTGVAPSFRVSGTNVADQAGAQLGQTITGVGMTLADMAAKKQAADNQTAVQNAKNNVVSGMNDVMYNENMGLMYTKGTQANGLTSAVDVTMKAKIQNELNSDALKGNKARQKAFMQSVQGITNAYRETAMEHEYKQGQVAAKEATDSSISSSASAFLNNYKQLSQTKDSQGNPITNYASDEALRSALSSRATYDMSQGMPQKAIEADLQQVSSGIIGTTIQRAIANNDFAGANAVLNRYGHDERKMSAEDYAKYNAAITKAAAPIRARTIAQGIMDKAGGDTSKALELLSAYKDDPNYLQIRSETKANIADKNTIQAQQKKDQENDILKNMMAMNTMQAQTTFINKLVADGKIEATEGASILSKAHSVWSAAHPKTPAKTAAEKKRENAAKYQLNGGLANDQATANEYIRKRDAGETISLSFQHEANSASARLTNFWSVMNGFDPKAAAARDEKVYNYLKVIYKAAEERAEKGQSKEYISKWATPFFERAGLDPATYLATFDWAHMGTKEGGVQ